MTYHVNPNFIRAIHVADRTKSTTATTDLFTTHQHRPPTFQYLIKDTVHSMCPQLTGPFQQFLTGLDATTALEVLTAVRGLANLGRTVVLSLHQPSQEMFELLDTCLLLGRGGYQAYYGKADR